MKGWAVAFGVAKAAAAVLAPPASAERVAFTSPSGNRCGQRVSVLSTADPLSYGPGRQLDSIRCAMLQSGIACEDFHTGRGFSLSRKRYEFF